MARQRWTILAVVVAAWLAVGPALAQDGITPIPGRPWTAVLPDPDGFDWTSNNRAGYRYRGMLPVHQRFHDYIQAKRATPGGLSEADRMMIRRLVALRRWPEAPRPNQFWLEFIRYLRNQPTTDLNLAQRIMLSQLFARGLAAMDNPGDENTRRLADYLNSGPFAERNWFERTFGRVEPWIAYEMAASGQDMGRGAAPGNVFPAERFNGLQITYNVTGATLGAPTDAGGFTNTRSMKGTLQAGGTLSVSGTLLVGGYGADVDFSVWAGDKRDEFKTYVKNEGAASASFNIKVPVAPGTKSGGFSLRLSGRYSMGGGYRGVVVSASLGQSTADAERERAEADAKWRAEVERTLKQLGYEDTPEGRELRRMRDALAAGEAGWRAYVDARQRELGYDPSPEAAACRKLRDALAAGGETWNDAAKTALGVDKLPDTVAAPSDVGGLKVGPSTNAGQVQGAADRFDPLPAVSCAFDYANLPDGSKIVAVWTRDGKEIIRSERAVGTGSGWVSFSLRGGGGGNLANGAYVVTLTVGDRVLGRKQFSIGPATGAGGPGEL